MQRKYSSVDQYLPPYLFRQPDLHTIFPAFLRRIPSPPFERTRLDTTDGDFIELDWLKSGSSKLAIISHGLEGSSRSTYVLGMTRALSKRGFDVLAWNFRGCGGEPNRLLPSYHSGKSDDLKLVVDHAASLASYHEIVLVGFSVGGNITLKYLGEYSTQVPSSVVRAATLSVPCDLQDSAQKMALPRNTLYMKWFLRLLHQKIREKIVLFPGRIGDKNFHELKNFFDFDSRYTAPLFGYRSAEHYWESNSAKQFLTSIKIPTLLVNAADDTFLGPSCFPHKEAAQNSNMCLEIPKYGGHVGFVERLGNAEYWSEQRIASFLVPPYF